MKIPLSWLKDYVDWPWTPAELAERLTMSGVNIEAVSTLGEGIRGAVAARVLKVAPHPNPPPAGEAGAGAAGAGAPGAAHHGYWVVDLDAGPAGRRQAVAGIANFRPGDFVAYAPPGSVLPGEWRIGVANLRGVASEGMLLSLSELVLGEKPHEGEGVLVLPGDPGSGLAPGADLNAALGLPETVLELDLTPNYAVHCQSVIGVAREVAALTGAGPAGLRYPDPYAALKFSGPPAAEACDVTIEAPDLCSRYVARVIRGVEIAPSPWRVQLRLVAAGMRPINNIVDATNYVMLEYGQPLHAFDLARLAGRHIIVRRARPGETVVTLDGAERSLVPDDLVIADEARAVAIAGVMGGENSEVTAGTRDILLESATFEPTSVRRTATRLALLSEAASRFDKGVDPEAAEPASARCAALLAVNAGGAVAPGTVDRNPVPYKPREVALRTGRVSALLGVELERAEVASYLGLLGFGVRPAAWERDASEVLGARPGPATSDARDHETEARGDLLVTIPSWRRDVFGEADLAEEVARLYGYNRIPSTLPRTVTTVGIRPCGQRVAERARRAMVAYGFAETVSVPFVDPERDALSAPAGRGHLLLANPLAGKQNAMRAGLFGGLLEAVRRNLSRAERDQRLFEAGTVYWPRSGGLGPANLPDERRHLAAVALGRGPATSWQDPGREPDFYYAKGLFEAVLRELGAAGWRVEPGSDRRFHPGRQARVVAAGGPGGAVVELGVLGELHPRILSEFDIEGRVAAFELDLDAVSAVSTADVRAAELPRFPAVERDVAVVLPEAVEAAAIQDVITEAAGELAAGVELFDVYRGHPVPAGQRSTAWRVTYRAADRSLTDAEVDEAHARVRAALERRLGATLR